MAAVFSTLSEFNNMAAKKNFFVKKIIINRFYNNEVEDFFLFEKNRLLAAEIDFSRKKSKNFIEFKK